MKLNSNDVLKQSDDTPTYMIAFKWADTLSQGEQDVLLASSLRRLQNMINTAIARGSESVTLPDPEDGNAAPV